MTKLLLTLKGKKLSQKHADKRQYKTKVSMRTISCSHPTPSIHIFTNTVTTVKPN